MNRIFLSLAVLLTLSCNKSETLDVGEDLTPESPMEVSISTASLTKGTPVNDPADMGSIGVYCAYTGTGTWTSKTEFKKLENRRFNITSDGDCVIDGESETWGYTSLDDKYTVFAYSPHNRDYASISPSIKDGELLIEYTVPQSSVNQPDLMFAKPQKDISPHLKSSIPLCFYHTLACVSFGVSASIEAKITEISITGVINSGTLSWNYEGSGAPSWSLGDNIDESFSVEIANYDTDCEETVQVNTMQGSLMMIPQTLTTGAIVTLRLDSGDKMELMIPYGSTWEAGSKYQYILNLDDAGDFIFNSHQVSNCYIINPTAGENTLIQIPVEERINDFWVNYAGKEKDKITSSTKTKNLSATLVWEDFSGSLSFSYEFKRDENGLMAVQLSVPAEFQEGNFVFAVEDISDTSNIQRLWSWHLWFTDYDPDAIADANFSSIDTSTTGVYERDNFNGAVHRYKDGDASTYESVWSGIYKDKFIMDRNIGARNSYNSGYGAGAVFYQYGRKDPFPGTGAVYYVNSKVYTAPGTRDSSRHSFEDSVELTRDLFIPATAAIMNWTDEVSARCNDGIYFIWYDKDILRDGYTVGKSIFDPSPLGWRVPVSDTWGCFNVASTVDSDDIAILTSYDYSYYGYRDATNNGFVAQENYQGCVWSCSQVDYETSRSFAYSDSKICSPSNYIVPYGFPVRAIQE